MKRRLFIGIPLAPNMEKAIEEEVERLKSESKTKIRFLPKETWHFTMTFLGYQEEAVAPLVEKAMEKTLETFRKETGSIEIEFDKIIYGPLRREPRMIWLTTTEKTSKSIDKLKKILEDNLWDSGVRWQRESRPYFAHLTLARFKNISVNHLPPLDRFLPLKYKAESFDFLASQLLPTGAVYTLIRRVAL